MEGPGAEAICGYLQPLALPDAGLAFGPLLGQLPLQALGTHGTHHNMPPTEMELLRPCSGQSGGELAGAVGDSDWHMLSLSSTVWIPLVIFV